MGAQEAGQRRFPSMIGAATSAPASPWDLPLSAVRSGRVLILGAAAAWSGLLSHLPGGCPLYSTTGIPCPVCGGTRSVTALAHGDVIGSLRFSPVGVVVVLVVIGALVLRRVDRIRVPPRLALAGLGLLWAWNVTLNPTF